MPRSGDDLPGQISSFPERFILQGSLRLLSLTFLELLCLATRCKHLKGVVSIQKPAIPIQMGPGSKEKKIIPR